MFCLVSDMTSEISSSFLSNTLKRRQQKRQEVTKVIQEGISSLNLEQQQHQQKLLKPVPIDLRKHNGTKDSSKFLLNLKYFIFIHRKIKVVWRYLIHMLK